VGGKRPIDQDPRAAEIPARIEQRADIEARKGR
jgi:hypothetical protein